MTYYVHEDGECLDLWHDPGEGWRRVSAKVGKAAQMAHAQSELRARLPSGSTVHCVLTHVSASGMSRSIKALMPTDDGIADLSWSVARAVGMPFDDRHGGVKVGGCGMDMGFHLVYSLSRALYPDGHACDGKGRCHSNDHTNGDREYLPTTHHADGGYALKMRWV